MTTESISSFESITESNDEAYYSDPDPSKGQLANLIVIYLTSFIDLAGFGLLLPLLPYYFEEIGGKGKWLSMHFGLCYGLMVGSFSLGQCLGGFVFGILKGKIGRKKSILISLFGSIIFFSLTGIFATTMTYLIMFRFFSGCFASATALCTSYIADNAKILSETEYQHYQDEQEIKSHNIDNDTSGGGGCSDIYSNMMDVNGSKSENRSCSSLNTSNNGEGWLGNNHKTANYNSIDGLNDYSYYYADENDMDDEVPLIHLSSKQRHQLRMSQQMGLLEASVALGLIGGPVFGGVTGMYLGVSKAFPVVCYIAAGVSALSFIIALLFFQDNTQGSDHYYDFGMFGSCKAVLKYCFTYLYCCCNLGSSTISIKKGLENCNSDDSSSVGGGDFSSEADNDSDDMVYLLGGNPNSNTSDDVAYGSINGLNTINNSMTDDYDNMSEDLQEISKLKSSLFSIRRFFTLLTRRNTGLLLLVSYINQSIQTISETCLILVIKDYYKMDENYVGFLFSAYGLVVASSQALLYPYVARYWAPAQVIKHFIMLCGVASVGMPMMPTFWSLCVVIGVSGLSYSLIMPSFSVAFSQSKYSENLFHTSRIVNAFARFGSPLIAGLLYDVNIPRDDFPHALPFWIAGGLSVLGFFAMCLHNSPKESNGSAGDGESNSEDDDHHSEFDGESMDSEISNW